MLVVTLLMGSAVSGGAQADEAEKPEVKGVEMQRADGSYLGLAVEGNAFVIRFYDAEKKDAPVDVERATARWSAVQKAGQQRTVLNPSGSALISPAVVRPPLVFNVFVSFISTEGEVTESFNFNLRTLNTP